MSSEIRRPSIIIALKGRPFTRKTEFAHLIARSLRCPVFGLDDVLNVLHPDYFRSPLPSGTCAVVVEPLSPHPRDLAFQIILDVTKTQLLGVSDAVVIDSPLSSQSHLDQLVNLATSLKARVVIVECRPKNTYSWRLKFENYLDYNPYYAQMWFKAKNWDEVETAIRDDYDERLDGDRVSKLVLDPFTDGPQFSHSYVIIPSVPIPFIEAIKYIMTREKGDGPIIVAYQQWRRFKYLPSLNTAEQRLCRGGHCISGYSEQGLEYEANCMACEKQVTGPAYTCKDCSLALHKECAESFDVNPDHKSGISVERFACTSCKEFGKSFSDDCASCLFKTHLNCRLMPTVIRRDCEEHFLSILLSPVQDEVYRCAACGEAGVSTIFYSCKICNLVYHYECLTEVPCRTKHEHGGHHHHMVLHFSTEEEAEDYICQECLQRRDPQLWFYSCEDCVYEAHLYCVLQRKDRVPSSTRILSFERKERLPFVVQQLLGKHM